MKFSTIYSNTVSISALLVALTFSSNAHAGYSSCTELSAPKNADSIFRSTGVPEQYAEDILHSSFRSNIEEIAKKESKDTVRVLQTDAASGEILTSLWTFFSRKGKNFIGIGVNEPGSRPPLSSNRVDLLRQRRIKIVEENLSYTHVGERQSRIATPLMFSALKNKHDLIIDCLGEFDNTKHVTGIVENSLNLLKIGGSYYLTIPWKYLITPTIAIKNNWPDVESISNMRLVSNDDTDFITKRENFMEGLKSNLQSSEIVRDDDSSFSLSGEHDEFDYERPTYGFSLAIDPNGSLDKTDRDTHYLLSLVRWLAQIEGVDLYIQTSNAYEANAINYTFENSLAEKSSVSESYVAWRDRYGIEKCASVDQTTHNTNQEASYIYDKYYECVYNLGELKLTNVNFKENPLAGGFLLSTDHHDQRFYQLFPNPKLPSVSRELKKYAGNDELKGSRAFSYGRGKSEPWLANTAFAEKIWNLQKQYGSLLFVKMVRTTDDSISVPRLRHTWSSIGEPSLRNFVTSDYKEDRDGSVGNFDDNNNDDVNSHSSDSLGSENVDLDISDDDNDDDANMHSSESSLGSMSDREEKIDE